MLIGWSRPDAAVRTARSGSTRLGAAWARADIKPAATATQPTSAKSRRVRRTISPPRSVLSPWRYGRRGTPDWHHGARDCRDIRRRGPDLPRSRPRDAAGDRQPARADRPRVGGDEDQGSRRGPRRGADRPRPRQEDPRVAASPRLPRGDDANRPDLSRREHRPGSVLQPASRRADASHPRGRLQRSVQPRDPHAHPRLPPRLDRRRLLGEPARGARDPALARLGDRRARPRCARALRPDGLQLGQRPGRPHGDGLPLQPCRAAAAPFERVPVARRPRAGRGRRSLQVTRSGERAGCGVEACAWSGSRSASRARCRTAACLPISRARTAPGNGSSRRPSAGRAGGRT